MSIQLKNLQIFCDIVRCRSFSRGASVSGVSQSYASQVVHQMEERLGLQLIDRSKRPLVLTDAGERYYEGCRQLIHQYEELEQEVKTLDPKFTSRLTVASIYSVGIAHMSRYLREFLAQHPDADVRLEYLHPDRVREVVESGAADIGIVSYPQETQTLQAVPWRDEELAIICAPDHALSHREHASLEQLRGEPLVGFQQNLQIREEIDRAFQLRHVEVTTALEFDNIETIKQAIEVGTGISILPLPTVSRELAAGSLIAIPITGKPLVRPLGVLFRRDAGLFGTAEDFVELLQSHADDAEAIGTAKVERATRK